MIYLDHNATTPVRDEVVEAMLPWLGRHYGNPSSVHRAGRLARQAVDEARAAVAALLGAQPAEVIFTSGGTEADNLALQAVQGRDPQILYGSTEHAAVLESVTARARQGVGCVELPVDGQGQIAEQALAERLVANRPQLVSVMWANNESGVIQNVVALGDCAHRHGALMHTDAVQAAGKLEIDFAGLPVDLLSVSAHKINGPKGVGALLARRSVALTPMQHGGGQEGGRRPGTENLAGIVGFGVAARLAAEEFEARRARALQLRGHLEAGLADLPAVHIVGQQAARVSNTTLITVAGFHSEALLMALDRRGIAVASGSACHAGSGRPSHVLLAMGYPEEQAHAAIRISFGEGNTLAEVDAFLASLRDLINMQRPALAPGLLVN